MCGCATDIRLRMDALVSINVGGRFCESEEGEGVVMRVSRRRRRDAFWE